MSQNFRFYRYMYENMKEISEVEYKRCATSYTSKSMVELGEYIHNNIEFLFFMFTLNEIEPLPSVIFKGCIKRARKVFNCRRESIEDLALKMNDIRYSSTFLLNNVLLQDVEHERLSADLVIVNIGGNWLGIKSYDEVFVIKPILSEYCKNYFCVIVDRQYYCIINADTKEVHTNDEDLNIKIYDSKTQLKRHLLLK